MIRLALLLFLTATTAQAEVQVYSFEVIEQQGSEANRLYLGALDAGLQQGGSDAADRAMLQLCEAEGLNEAQVQGLQGVLISEITIRLANKPLNYGQVDPQAVQFMSFYDISSGECVWH